MKVEFRWRKYRYFPYEQRLARRELAALTRCQPQGHRGGLSVNLEFQWEPMAARTTYFEAAVPEKGRLIVPLQTLLEASTNIGTSHLVRGSDNKFASRRQSTRYSSHGLHEYKGKFNPQIVRAVGNVLDLRQGSWILDPFCGSGTTLLEAAHAGWNAIGVDFNPLAVEIARAKIAALRVEPHRLLRDARYLTEQLQRRFRRLSFTRPFSNIEISAVVEDDWEDRLPCIDYLRSWFVPSVLVQLSVTLGAIEDIANPQVRRIFRVVLSDILRVVSLQDDGDLRIRRRKSPPENAPAVPLFLEGVAKRIDLIVRARQVLGRIRTRQYAFVGDSRKLDESLLKHASVTSHRSFDAAVSSPPYATALPYVDTQRFSLVVLGLTNHKQAGLMQKDLIGTREIGDRQRRDLEGAIEENSANLPRGCATLCLRLKNAVDSRRDGFRRRNVPALIYKYLADMAATFRRVANVLKPNAPFAIVIGPNRTRLGGRSFLIDTPHLIRLLAEENRFETQEILSLNTYQRYDLHRANSIQMEELILVRRV